jgi:hypothetical protein
MEPEEKRGAGWLPEDLSSRYVTEIREHDVLLGRGTGPNNNQGNVVFRIAVEKSKAAYTATSSRKSKNRTVRETVEAVKAKNGRFLSKLKKYEIKRLGLTHKVVYEVVEDSTAIEKTKQALRYVCYKKDSPHKRESSGRKDRKRKATSSDGDSASAGDDLDKSQGSKKMKVVAQASKESKEQDFLTSIGQSFNTQYGPSPLGALPHATKVADAPGPGAFLQAATSAQSSNNFVTPLLAGTNPQGNQLSSYPSLFHSSTAESFMSGTASATAGRALATILQQQNIINELTRERLATSTPSAAGASQLGVSANSGDRSVPNSSSQGRSDQTFINDLAQQHLAAAPAPNTASLLVHQGSSNNNNQQFSASSSVGINGRILSSLQDDRVLAALRADEQYRLLISQLSASGRNHQQPPPGR